MSEPLFDLQSTHNSRRWFLPLLDANCVGPEHNRFMFGGVGLGAAIVAMERTCNQPVVWATAQYLSFARPPSIVDFDVWIPAQGQNTSQVRVIAHVEDKEVLTVNAALGRRPNPISHQRIRPEPVPRPETCEIANYWDDDGENLHSRLDVRIAQVARSTTGASEDGLGRFVLWIRPKHTLPIDSGLLAIMADHVPAGVRAILGPDARGSSLDNTIRFRRIVPTEWVLCEVHIDCIYGGFGHGSMRLFSEDGELMAIASQSMIIRLPSQTKFAVG